MLTYDPRLITPSILRSPSHSAGERLGPDGWENKYIFLISGDPASNLHNMTFDQVFAGTGVHAKVESCSKIFTDIVTSVGPLLRIYMNVGLTLSSATRVNQKRMVA